MSMLLLIAVAVVLLSVLCGVVASCPTLPRCTQIVRQRSHESEHRTRNGRSNRLQPTSQRQPFPVRHPQPRCREKKSLLTTWRLPLQVDISNNFTPVLLVADIKSSLLSCTVHWTNVVE